MLTPYTINMFYSLAFLAKGDVNIIMIALMTGIITLAILTLWWEPLTSLKGAAWAALSAEVVHLLFWSFKIDVNIVFYQLEGCIEFPNLP
jgi:hypothetical protein